MGSTEWIQWVKKKLKTQIGVYREVGGRSERTCGKEVTIIKIQHMKVSKN